MLIFLIKSTLVSTVYKCKKWAALTLLNAFYKVKQICSDKRLCILYKFIFVQFHFQQKPVGFLRVFFPYHYYKDFLFLTISFSFILLFNKIINIIFRDFLFQRKIRSFSSTILIRIEEL